MCALQETLKISQVLIVLFDVHIVHPGARPASWPRVCVEHPASWNYLPLSWPWMAWLVAFLPTPRGHLTWVPMKTGKRQRHTLLTHRHNARNRINQTPSNTIHFLLSIFLRDCRFKLGDLANVGGDLVHHYQTLMFFVFLATLKPAWVAWCNGCGAQEWERQEHHHGGWLRDLRLQGGRELANAV